ncbi:MAG: GNAT family N-acetyltransferase [Candidatus Rokuibacteriota bacterium]|nr:MAG: GNAT family N-acetyltransferase [Candidatus Rokubacteria bacterium]
MTELGGCVHRPPRGGIASGPATIETLRDLPPERVRDLLADSEAAGSRIVRRLVDEWADQTNRFDRPGEALFAARVAGRLVGVCGLNVDPYAGAPRAGRVRHLYVLTSFRGRGVGRQLVAHVIDSAGGRFDTLRLRTNNEAAARLYAAMGFRPRTESGEFTHVLELGRRPC